MCSSKFIKRGCLNNSCDKKESIRRKYHVEVLHAWRILTQMGARISPNSCENFQTIDEISTCDSLPRRNKNNSLKWHLFKRDEIRMDLHSRKIMLYLVRLHSFSFVNLHFFFLSYLLDVYQNIVVISFVTSLIGVLKYNKKTTELHIKTVLSSDDIIESDFDRKSRYAVNHVSRTH